jgi:T-complex protein 1 subunit theta
LSVGKVESLTDKEQLTKIIKGTISSKQYGYEEFLGDLVCEAALNIMPKNAKDFNVDNVRVVKVMGSSIHESRVVRGMVFGREPDGMVQKATAAKVAVFTCPLDISDRNQGHRPHPQCPGDAQL